MRRRLGPIDHAWLRMDRPENPMMITGVLTFDEPLDRARLRRTLEARIPPFPRLSQRVEVRRGGAAWVDDPSFTLERHVTYRVLPEPADRATLRRVISELVSTPLPRDRPLWHIHVLENPHDGRTVMVVRLHHCIGDGFALMYVMLSFTDDRPDANEERPLELAAAQPTALGEARRTLARARTSSGREALAVGADLARLATLSTQPRSVVRGPLGGVRRAAWSAPIPLARVKEIGRRRGGTVNDVLVAATTGALSRYLVERGEDVRGFDLRAAVPVNLRTPDQMRELGNYFGLVFLDLPLWISDPRARLEEVKRRMNRLKRSPEPLVLLALMQIVGVAPRALEELVVRFLGAKTTAVFTNVPGPREPRYLAGRRIRTVMFWVPATGRVGLGVSIFSYAGEVRLGLSADARLLPDPDRVLDVFGEELERLA